jgi:proline dehydrogenase
MKLPFALASRFVAGETLDTAVATVGGLLDDGRFVTLDLLGEHVHERPRADAFAREYVDLVDRVAALRDQKGVAPEAANISIKLSMIGQVIDRDLAERNLRALLDRAREADVFVRLDMEGSDITASTLGLFEAVYPDYEGLVGPVLQAYLHRTAADVTRMVELQARVRLCKGAYKEPASIAYQDMPTIRWHYRRLARTLLTHGRYPGIATHDDELIGAVKQMVAADGVSRDAFEFQMLYGIRAETQRQIVDEGYRMRVYVPYGTEWVPYFSRRLRERKENVWFVLENLVRR